MVLPNGDVASGPVVDVRVQEEAELSERIFGTVNPLLGSAVGVVALLVISLFLLFIARATSRQGSRDTYDWDDDFEDDYEDEHDEAFDEPEVRSRPLPLQKPRAAAPKRPRGSSGLGRVDARRGRRVVVP